MGGNKVEVFESSKRENRFAVCAWGASKHMLAKFSEQAGLRFEQYIFHTGKLLRMELPNGGTEYLDLRGLVTYDKQKWENDLLDDNKITYGIRCSPQTFAFGEYDYVIDCTGLHRSLLPKSKEDFIIPAYEYLVDGIKDIKEFFKEHCEAKIIKKIGRPIRLAPPKRMQPLHYKNLIGVGESIGCVFPMLGEGIISSLLCSNIFLEVFNCNQQKFDFKKYRKKILNEFGYYDIVYRIVRLKMEGKLNTLKHFNLLMNMYRNMKKEEMRFGFEISL